MYRNIKDKFFNHFSTPILLIGMSLSLLISAWFAHEEYYEHKNEYYVVFMDDYKDHIDNVLRNYANEIEKESPELAQKFYAANGGNSAIINLTRLLKEHLFLVSDKYENKHALPIKDTHKVSNFVNDMDERIYLRDCKWLVGVDTWAYNWRQKYCSDQFTKLHKDHILFKLLVSETIEIKNTNIKNSQNLHSSALESSFSSFFRSMITLSITCIILSILIKKVQWLQIIFKKYKINAGNLNYKETNGDK